MLAHGEGEPSKQRRWTRIAATSSARRGEPIIQRSRLAAPKDEWRCRGPEAVRRAGPAYGAPWRLRHPTEFGFAHSRWYSTGFRLCARAGCLRRHTETPRETTGALVQVLAGSTSRDIGHWISPSSHRQFKRTITSWVKAEHLGSGLFGLVYEATCKNRVLYELLVTSNMLDMDRVWLKMKFKTCEEITLKSKVWLCTTAHGPGHGGNATADLTGGRLAWTRDQRRCDASFISDVVEGTPRAPPIDLQGTASSWEECVNVPQASMVEDRRRQPIK